jgi:acetyl esterase/lipase
MCLPKGLTLHGSLALSLSSLIALLVGSFCSATSNAQTPTLNDLLFATVTNDNGTPASLHMDLWENTTGGSRAPLLIWIHGGGCSAGTYNTAPSQLQALLQSGYAVASVEYRLSGAAIFPAQIYDVKGAVRFLRAHADDYHLDPTRFASWGDSAGGHLSALLATSGGGAAVEGTVGGNLDYSSQVEAAADNFGPTDLLQMNLDVTAPPGSVINHDAPNSPESQLIGFSGSGQGIGVLRNNLSNPNPPYPAKVALAQLENPITHVTPDDPPMLIAHGDQHTLVPMKQSVRLSTALGSSRPLQSSVGPRYLFNNSSIPRCTRPDAHAIEGRQMYFSARS